MANGEHANGNGHRRGIHFDPTINLGHIAQIAMLVFVTAGAYFTLDSRVARLETEQRAIKVDHKEAVVGAETRLLTRITEQRAHMDQTQVRTADDVREIKALMRDGFRDLDAKLDRKMDKPGR